jgi:cytochrome c551/c552
MKALFSLRKTVVAWVLLLAVILLVSCTPDANAPIVSPQLGTILAAREAGEMVAAVPTPTPVLLVTLSDDQIYAGLPDDLRAAIASADPARGDSLAVVNACKGCHALEPGVALAGPTWVNIGDTAAGRIPNMSPAEYIHRSIVDPNSYIVPGFQAGIMPQNFSERLSVQDQADLIVFLLSHHQ